jgi:hypothetical protein
MTLLNLRNRNCVICHIRGDSVKKEKVIEIKESMIAEKLKDVFNLADLSLIGSIYCKKNFHQMKAKDINNNYTDSTTALSQYNNNDTDSTTALSQYNNNDTDSTTTFSQYDDENENINKDFNLSKNNNEDLSELNNNRNKNKLTYNSCLVVDLPKTFNSHKYCFICKKASGKYNSRSLTI